MNDEIFVKELPQGSAMKQEMNITFENEKFEATGCLSINGFRQTIINCSEVLLKFYTKEHDTLEQRKNLYNGIMTDILGVFVESCIDKFDLLGEDNNETTNQVKMDDICKGYGSSQENNDTQEGRGVN